MEKAKIVAELKNRVENFLGKVAEKEEQKFRLRLKLDELETIVHGRGKKYESVNEYYLDIEKWFSREGKELLEKGLTREQLEKIIDYVEKMKEHRKEFSGPEESRQEGEIAGRILNRCNAFIRDSTRRLGLEYTLLGLMDAVQPEDDRLNLMAGIRMSLPKKDSLKSEYRRLLDYQNQMLDFFYKPEEHILTVLDYQLRTLEVRYSEEDEFLTSCLINFLRLKNYRIAPYVERFRKIASAKAG